MRKSFYNYQGQSKYIISEIMYGKTKMYKKKFDTSHIFNEYRLKTCVKKELKIII